jgi:hypothetical protein
MPFTQADLDRLKANIERGKGKSGTNAPAKKETSGEQPKKNKYGNKIVVYDNIKFRSIKERERYKILKLAEHAGEITQLRLQQTHKFVVNGVHICNYISDFEYSRDGVKIYEDAKGCRTRIYEIKKALMRACFGIEILET